MKTKKGPKISDKLRRNGGLENKSFEQFKRLIFGMFQVHTVVQQLCLPSLLENVTVQHVQL